MNEYGSDKITSDEYVGQTMVYERNWGVQKNDTLWQPAEGYDKHPIVYVTWYGVYEYCRYYGYTLPTEAQWEYAARGGNQSKGYEYDGSNNIDSVAWYDVNSYHIGPSHPDYGTHKVAGKKPNEPGIYDMSGNVYEWCNDWYSKHYYNFSKGMENPQGAPNGSYRVLRGSSFHCSARYCRVAYRSNFMPGHGYFGYGFRLAVFCL